MTELALHLAYLLQRHDCVALPGFGAFLKMTESARYDAHAAVFMPPTCSLVFNPALVHNDGLIVESVARRDGISFARGRQKVEALVASLKAALAADGEVALPGVGVLQRGASVGTTPTFIPDGSAVVAHRMAWLPKVDIRPLAFSEEEATPLIDETRPAMPGFSFMWRVAAMAAIVLSLGFFATIPSTNSAHTDYASIAVTPTRHAAVAVAETMSAQPERVLSIAMPGNEDDVIATDAEGEVYLIVASLQSRKRAEQFIASTGDNTLQILHSDGHYRVYSGRYATRLQALHARAQSSYAGAWVLGE